MKTSSVERDNEKRELKEEREGDKRREEKRNTRYPSIHRSAVQTHTHTLAHAYTVAQTFIIPTHSHSTMV